MSSQAPRQGHNSAFPNTCQEVRRGAIRELWFWGISRTGSCRRKRRKGKVSIQSPLLKAVIAVVKHPFAALVYWRSWMKWLNHVVVKQGKFLTVPHKRAFSCLRGHMTEWIQGKNSYLSTKPSPSQKKHIEFCPRQYGQSRRSFFLLISS